MMSSEKGMSLNIGGSQMDPTALALAAMNGKSNDGMGGCIWPILLLVLLPLLSRGGLYGNNEAATVAAANNNDFMQIMKELCDLSKEVCSSASGTRTIVDANGDRILASNNTQTALTNAGFAETRKDIADNANLVTSGFSRTRDYLTEQFNNTNSANTNAFNSLSKEIGCGFSRQNDVFNAYTRLLDTNLCNSFGKVYAQNSAIKCGIEKLENKIDCTSKVTDALIVSSKQDILRAIQDSERAAQLAAKDAEIARLKECRHDKINNDMIVNINSNNNAIADLSRSLNLLIANLSSGRANGNS